MALTFIAQAVITVNQNQIAEAQRAHLATVYHLGNMTFPDLTDRDAYGLLVPSIDYLAGENYAPWEVFIAWMQPLLDLPIWVYVPNITPLPIVPPGYLPGIDQLVVLDQTRLLEVSVYQFD